MIGGDAARVLNGTASHTRFALAGVLEEEGALFCRYVREPTPGGGPMTPPEPDPAALNLPVRPPVSPMLAKAVKKMPEQDGSLFYEPKWDGFRCIVFRDGDEVFLGSRNERPFTRYFPEVIEAVKRELPERCVLDGEIVVMRGPVLDFEALQQRIHPAASRVNMLSEATPASFIAFDLLAVGDEDLTGRPFSERRERLVEVTAKAGDSIRLTPITRQPGAGARMVRDVRGGRARRDHRQAGRPALRAGQTRHVQGQARTDLRRRGGRLPGTQVGADRGVAAARALRRRRQAPPRRGVGVVPDEAARGTGGRAGALQGHRPRRPSVGRVGARGPAAGVGGGPEGQRLPGAISRWNAKKDLSFIPLRPELVIEVAYDHMEGVRFRHTAQFRRWRTDRTPESCTYEQLEVPVAYNLDDILAR